MLRLFRRMGTGASLTLPLLTGTVAIGAAQEALAKSDGQQFSRNANFSLVKIFISSQLFLYEMKALKC